jgi:hypothetical protein
VIFGWYAVVIGGNLQRAMQRAGVIILTLVQLLQSRQTLNICHTSHAAARAILKSRM